jgi:hypothetical protein
VSKHALARVDVERLRLSAEIQENWLPFVLGPMMLRPGLGYVGAIADNLQSRILPFVFGTTDTALIELVDESMRVWIDDELVERPSVSTAVTSGTFSSSTGWTLASGTGITAQISSNVLKLASATAGAPATAKQQIAVAAADVDVEHAFRIVVIRGPVTFKAGSTDGGDDYIAETVLDTGEHSLAFTPAGNVFLQLENASAQRVIVDGVTIEAAGIMEVATSFTEDDLSWIRFEQSGDVIWLAVRGQRQCKIERRAAHSWSVTKYYANDGPFLTANLTDLTLTPAALSGNTTLTASRALFKSEHVGALFRLFSQGQTAAASIAAQNTFTDAIRVSGVGADRAFSIAISGAFTATVVLQRSFDSATSGFSDVSGSSWTAATSTSFQDDFDNSIIWYRLGVKTGAYTSGTATCGLTYTGGGKAGICRVTDYVSSTQVGVEVLTAFGSTAATSNWSEGHWSDLRGWPSSVGLHDGRLFWAGGDRIWGSVSDDYTSFDADTEGDSAPISRSLGSGPVDSVNWLLPLSRLIAGREGSETSIRSSSFDEPLTPTNFTLKNCSTQGSAPIGAVRVDTAGLFVQRSDRRVYELAFNVDAQDYVARDMTRLNLDIGVPGFVDAAVQRQADTQVHFVLGSGEVAVLVYDRGDAVEAWWRIVTRGTIEAVAVLPGAIEDSVYFVVRRNIDGGFRRYLEKMAMRHECVGDDVNKQADSFVYQQSGSATATVTGLHHLENEEVVIWADGADVGTKTVRNGSITLDTAARDVVVGLAYEARFKSAKLAYAAGLGTALTQTKKVDQLGVILLDSHYQGLEYGPDFDNLDPLPEVEDGDETEADTVWAEFDGPMFEFDGEWDTDARLCLVASAPRPCTVAAAIVAVRTNEKG